MKHKTAFPVLFSLFAFVVSSGNLLGQGVQISPGDGVKIGNVELNAQGTPDFEADGVKDKKVPKPKQWLELEVEFEVDKVNPRDAVVPELLFRYYIGIVGEGGQANVLTGDVTHVNVQGGETMYSAVYVAPATMGRMTGEYDRVDTNGVYYGVEIFYNGVLVGGYSSSRGKFWEGKGTSSGILSRDKTPFALLWIDRYPETKKQ